MNKNVFRFAGVIVAVLALFLIFSGLVMADDGKLRIIAFGAHPDDCEIKAGGVAAMWIKQGHHVKFVSVTNGDIGHFKMAGGPLAQRRVCEVQKAAKILGIETQVLDNHDGELMPTLENRRTITRLIREWKADIVLTHRPNDYHPDHRYTGILVQDAAFMVTVPFFCPDVPHLSRNPVFMFFLDRFQKPNPFDPDLVISIDNVLDQKLEAIACMESQFVEGGVSGNDGRISKNETERAESHRRVRNAFARRFEQIANTYREKLIELYSTKKGKEVHYAEAFELCEYGRRPSVEELKQLFPLFEQ